MYTRGTYCRGRRDSLFLPLSRAPRRTLSPGLNVTQASYCLGNVCAFWAGLSKRLLEYAWLFLRAHARPAAAIYASPDVRPTSPAGASASAGSQGNVCPQEQIRGVSPEALRPQRIPLKARTVRAQLKCMATFAAVRVFKQRLGSRSKGVPSKEGLRSAGGTDGDALKVATTPHSEKRLPSHFPLDKTSSPNIMSGGRAFINSSKKAAATRQCQAAFALCYTELLRLVRKEVHAAFSPSSGVVCPAAGATARVPGSALVAQRSRGLLQELRQVAIKAESEAPQAWPRWSRPRVAASSVARPLSRGGTPNGRSRRAVSFPSGRVKINGFTGTPFLGGRRLDGCLRATPPCHPRPCGDAGGETTFGSVGESTDDPFAIICWQQSVT
ncbi:uncharacterized protein LOC113147258 [Cyclospora cayetanensis]|uniref:Uncharacterized protein LOC113147258 n=1 Tax=Cyclospora cayetanensis TaxID=88456 RepID=A0A6P6RYI4_9EIME|nr:uncharacterized protein LOC113147258 [Cyclospora cayetanensis]